MYCGDDVSSVVLDIGSFHTRAGYSGEDVPRCVLPSTVGFIPGGQNQASEYQKEIVNQPNFICGSTEMAYHRPEMSLDLIVDD